jgi:parvulin-like peptidyl-prolyl isomerase
MSVENPASKAMPVVPPDRVVVTVGDLTITAAQFDQIIEALPEQYRSVARGSGRKQFADNVVRIAVLAQEGKRRKLDESSAYRTQSMFEDANILANMTYEEISKNAKLDEADVRKYYEAHKAEFEQVRARHILIRVQGSPSPVRPGQKDLTDAEALAKAQDLRKKILAGADFAQLAREESDDSGSGANGGDLGSFRHGQMVPTFEQAAFAMQPGDLSEPVKSPFGYHLIKVEATESKSFEEVRPELERRMRPEQAQKALEELQKKTPAVLDPEFFGIAKKLGPDRSGPRPPSARVLGMPSPYCALWAIRLQAVSAPVGSRAPLPSSMCAIFPSLSITNVARFA